MARKYAQVYNIARYFVDRILKNPEKNFGLDTFMKNVQFTLTEPDNLTQLPAVYVKELEHVPTVWRRLGKTDSDGNALIEQMIEYNVDIIMIVQKDAAIKYNGTKYKSIDGYNLESDEVGFSTRDVMRNVMTDILLLNWQYDPADDGYTDEHYLWNDIRVTSFGDINKYNNNNRLFAVAFRCTFDVELDIPYSELYDD